jgi:hypothetical protein
MNFTGNANSNVGSQGPRKACFPRVAYCSPLRRGHHYEETWPNFSILLQSNLRQKCLLSYLADFLPMECIFSLAMRRERVASPSMRYFSTISFFLQLKGQSQQMDLFKFVCVGRVPTSHFPPNLIFYVNLGAMGTTYLCKDLYKFRRHFL